MTQSPTLQDPANGPYRGGSGRWLAGFCLARAAFSMEMTTFTAAAKLLEGEWGMSAGQTGSEYFTFNFGWQLSGHFLQTL